MLCLLQSQQLTPLSHGTLSLKLNVNVRRGSWKLESTIQDPETHSCARSIWLLVGGYLSFPNLRNKRQRLRKNGELLWSRMVFLPCLFVCTQVLWCSPIIYSFITTASSHSERCYGNTAASPTDIMKLDTFPKGPTYNCWDSLHQLFTSLSNSHERHTSYRCLCLSSI